MLNIITHHRDGVHSIWDATTIILHASLNHLILSLSLSLSHTHTHTHTHTYCFCLDDHNYTAYSET